MSQKERRFLPHLGQQFVQVVRRRRTCSGLQVLLRRDAVQKPVICTIEEFAFLPFLHTLDDEAKLLSDLVVRFAEEVGYPGMNIKYRTDGAQLTFFRILLVLDVRFRRGGLLDLATGDFNGLALVDTVEAEGSGFERFPVQKANQPAGRDRSVLGAVLVTFAS